MIDICSKFLLITPIKNPNNAKVNETKTNRNIINIGYLTVTSAKNDAVIKITVPTIKVFVAPAPTKARTVSSVDIGAAKISLIVPLNFGKNIPNEVLLID
jgi:3-dehydroquinate dehydratase